MIVMTIEEATLIHTVRPELPFYQHPDQRFVYLQGKPCPLLAYDTKGLAVCTEYERRPFSCRRFGCFRPDPKTEPYEAEPVDLTNRRLGCANLSDRLSNRKVRKEYIRLQAKGQKWARKHGWTDDMTGEPIGSSVVMYERGPNGDVRVRLYDTRHKATEH